jgi:transcriptional regulator with XRE-family HTH domain
VKAKIMQFIYTISPIQSKAARTYLDWTQQDLGREAGIDRSTVRNFENGLSPRRESVVKIRKALEKHGIEFTEDDGVKRRGMEVKVHQGIGSRAEFYNDLLQTAKERCGEIYCVLPSQAAFMRVFGVDEGENLEQLAILGKIAKIKCLVTEPSASNPVLSTVQFRLTANHIIRSDFIFGYGNKYVIALERELTDFTFVLLHTPQTAQEFRLNFLSAWEDAEPLRLSQPQFQSERRARVAIGG